MSEVDAGGVLDSEVPPQLPSSWPLKRWAAIARDRVDDIGAVTSLQRSSACGFFVMTTVYVRHESRWCDEFANGHVWDLPPTAPRPHGGRPIASLTSVIGVAVGKARIPVACVAGVATTAVSSVRASSPAEEHDVDVDDGSGAFVALTIQQSGGAEFRLAALDRAGHELDHIDYRDPCQLMTKATDLAAAGAGRELNEAEAGLLARPSRATAQLI